MRSQNHLDASGVREIITEGLALRLRTIRPYGRRSLTYVEVLHDGAWLDCGDPHHGETRSRRAQAALAHYARTAIRNADMSDRRTT